MDESTPYFVAQERAAQRFWAALVLQVPMVSYERGTPVN